MKDIEEKIYEFGNACYRIGRMETDDKSSSKDYNSMVKKKEELTKFFDEFFGNQTKKMN
jgi:hypothetical protein